MTAIIDAGATYTSRPLCDTSRTGGREVDPARKKKKKTSQLVKVNAIIYRTEDPLPPLAELGCP